MSCDVMGYSSALPVMGLVALIGAIGWLALYRQRRTVAALAAQVAAYQSHELSLVHEIHHLRHPRISVSLRELNRFKGQLRRELSARPVHTSGDAAKVRPIGARSS
jgi:cell division protein FtsB